MTIWDIGHKYIDRLELHIDIFGLRIFFGFFGMPKLRMKSLDSDLQMTLLFLLHVILITFPFTKKKKKSYYIKT